MQIVCPACTAAYEVPLTMLKPGQAVRCARCAHEWVPSLTALPAEPVAVPVAPRVDTEPMRDEISLPLDWSPVASHGTVLRLAWAGSVLALLLLGWAAYAERTPIMQAWPPSVRVYAALGLVASP
jgi:predicted Zn finger-like uncharacterized protein